LSVFKQMSKEKRFALVETMMDKVESGQIPLEVFSAYQDHIDRMSLVCNMSPDEIVASETSKQEFKLLFPDGCEEDRLGIIACVSYAQMH